MKKHFLMGLALLMGAGVAVAQPTAATAPAKLLGAAQGLMAPVWSPDGSQIAVTTDNYAGILVANADGSDLRVLTNAAGAGYKMTWTADGSAIVGRTNVIEAGRVLHEICSWQVADGRVTTLRAKHRTNATPTLRAAGLSQTQTGVYDLMTADPASAAGQIAALNEFAGRTIINPALSPDGQKVAFQIVGKGMWMINADGTGLRSLGAGSHPAWLPDSRCIVYTIVSDNGNEFTSSLLMSMDTATNRSVVLTEGAGIIPLTPAVSPDGKKVAFENAADASIYTINLKF